MAALAGAADPVFFGLVNAGVPLTSVGIGTWIVLTSLLAGKPFGILLAVGVARWVGLHRLHRPPGVTWRDMLVLAVTAGVGFTIALCSLRRRRSRAGGCSVKPRWARSSASARRRWPSSWRGASRLGASVERHCPEPRECREDQVDAVRRPQRPHHLPGVAVTLADTRNRSGGSARWEQAGDDDRHARAALADTSGKECGCRAGTAIFVTTPDVDYFVRGTADPVRRLDADAVQTT
jgi:hypothetical protein